MAIIYFVLSLLIVPAGANVAFAEDSSNAEALIKTQDLLRDSSAREKSAAESTKASATMKSAESFVGKENAQELYDLTADVMGTITNQSHGDAKLMSEDLKKSPEDFIKFLTPEELAKIEALAKKIESQRNPSSFKPD